MFIPIIPSTPRGKRGRQAKKAAFAARVRTVRKWRREVHAFGEAVRSQGAIGRADGFRFIMSPVLETTP